MKKLLGYMFQGGLRLNAWLTRSRYGRGVEQRLLTPMFVRLTRQLRGQGVVARTPEALGRQWEHLLGNRRYAHVTRVDASTATVYGEITGWCPLRGTGDLAACHRLMAYDRGLMAPSGARVVVLASQAEPGRHSCLIAIRDAELPSNDLVAAHEAP
jgi:hypothetical protein